VTGLVEVLTQNILPIFLVAGLGFWLKRSRGLDPRPVAAVVFNGFSPCLVFVALVNSRLPPDELARLGLFSLLVILLMGLIGLVAGHLLRLTRTEKVVLLLVVMFVNGGNYGLTLNQLRYGEAGLSRAIVYYIVSTILVFTLGVFIASMGQRPWQDAARRLLRVPALYAVLAAIAVYSFQLTVPAPLYSAIEVAADGAIPAMLVVLGMNMARLQGKGDLRLAIPAVSLRLLVAPLVALLVAGQLGLEGLSRSTAIIEASMPAAVIITVIATEFDVKPLAVTGIVVLSTLFSPLTLAVFINLFGL